MNAINVSNNLFFQNLTQDLASGKKALIRAKGNSMLPFIRSETDCLVLETVNRSLKKGMVVLAKTDVGKYVIHRIEKIDVGKITLRGDGNLYDRESCSTENVIAILTTVIRGEKKIEAGSYYWRFYRYICPQNSFLRRILLAVYRKTRKYKRVR